MRSSTLVLLAAIVTVALPTGVTPASATKMNGKCCTSSDGGRSWRYKTAPKQAALRHKHSNRHTGGM